MWYVAGSSTLHAPDHHTVRQVSHSVHLLNGHLINLVVHIQARHVHTVARDHVYQLV